MKNPDSVEIRCKCPFCGGENERLTASINQSKGLFHCFKCGEGLNAVSLYANVYGTSIKDAYRELLEKVS